MTTQLLKSKIKSAPSHKSTARNGHAREFDIVINGNVLVPSWVINHDSFRQWACTEAISQRGQFFFLGGELWVDLSMETLIHNQIKGAIAMGLGSFLADIAVGRYLGDRMMLTHIESGLSCEPDGMYIADTTFQNGSVTLEKGDESLEIIGSPDLVVEVVSKTSLVKDNVTLKGLYAQAGIAEYWLVDSTIDKPELVIMRLASGKYVTARKHDGWVKSHVFGRSFRLSTKKDAHGLSQFSLETK